MTNLYAELDTVFVAQATKDCLRIPAGDTWRYQDIRDLVAKIAHTLVAEGLVPGDRLVVQVEKSPQNLALYLATLSVGGVYVPLNTAYTAAELDYFLADAQPALFVGQTEHKSVPSLTLSKDGRGGLMEALPQKTPDLTIVERAADDLAAILYTSGTTGRSKGAMLTHGNLSTNAHRLCESWGWRSDDVLLHALPIFHVHGLFIASHCALLTGTPMIWLAKFSTESVMAALPECTVMMGVPTFYARLLLQPDFPEGNLSRLRVFICGSAPLTEQVFLQWQARTGHSILERYGMSETIINTTNPLAGERVAGTVGFSLTGLSLRITNEEGVELPAGEVGSIEVRGPSVFRGYWNMPEKTRSEFRQDGHFITGDLGSVDQEGRLSIVGRSKDMIISGGFNVYPKEVERLLDELPHVSESAVIGVPHADFGEAVVAIVVPCAEDVTLDQVNLALKDELARFKQPKTVVNVSSLPRNAMGKVQKNLLRDQFKQVLDNL